MRNRLSVRGAVQAAAVGAVLCLAAIPMAGQQERGPVRLGAGDGQRPLVDVGFLLERPVDVGLGADDGDGRAIDDAHPPIVSVSDGRRVSRNVQA